MTSSSPRIPPLSPAHFSEEQKSLVGDWSNLNFSRVCVRHPGMYRVFLPFIERLITQTTLPPRDREVVILRSLALADDVYETHHHVLIARNAGMTDSEIEAAKESGEGLSRFERVLMQATEELMRNQCIGDVTWAELSERYSETQLMELVFLVGCYTTMGMLTNTFEIPVEQDAATFAELGELRQYT